MNLRDIPHEILTGVLAITLLAQLGLALRNRLRAAVAVRRAAQSAREQTQMQLGYLRALIQTMPNPVLWRDRAGLMVDCNDAYEQLFGLSRDALLGKTALDLEPLAPALRRSQHESNLRVMEDGIETIQLVSMPDSRGRLRELQLQRRPIRDEHNLVIGMLGVLTDVTDQNRRERFERFRSKILEALTTLTPDWVVGSDAQADILQSIGAELERLDPESCCVMLVLDPAQPRIARALGPTAAESLRRALEGMGTGPGQAPFGVALAHGEPTIAGDLEHSPPWAPLRQVCRDAGFAACWLQPIHDAAGAPFGLVALFRRQIEAPEPEHLDLLNHVARLTSIAMEHIRTTEALARSEAHMSTLVDTIPDLIWLKDPSGIYLAANPKFQRFYGVPHAEIIGKKDYDFVPVELADAFRENDLKAMSSPSGNTNEEWLTFAADGYRGLFETRKLATYDRRGTLIGVLGVARDITDRRQLTTQLEAAKTAAEAAADAKSSFLANMSHEIRTPMNAIIGLTELALRTLLTPRQQDYLGKIHAAANSLLGLLNDILDLSKIEAGKMHMESVSFELDSVLDGLATVMAVQVEDKGLELLFAKDPEVPRRLIGDPLRLRQVLTNLTNNAMKFTERGDIILSTALVRRDAHSVRLRFLVRDSGIGISEDKLAGLFKPFTQADESTTRRFGGTGLGLAISRQIVELMNGRIWAESEPGVGSTFAFEAEFGLAAMDHDSARELGDIASEIRDLKVLVVDDNPNAREILRSHLEHLSFRVETDDSAEHALARLQQAPSDDPFKLVLMDYRMPGMDGIAGARRIRREMPDPPKIVLVTAATRLASDELDEGVVDEMLTKPVNASLLFDVVADLFGKTAGRSRGGPPEAGVNPAALRAIQGARLLVVEDNEINRQVATELLEQAGFIVECAVDGADGLAKAEANTYDCVLMDIQMPVMDGYTAAARLRSQPRFKELPILAMTANVLAEDRAKVAAVGMNGHIAKPIELNALLQALLAWIPPGERALPENFAQTGAEAASTALPGALPGLKLDAALRRLADNRNVLQRLLVDFAREHRADQQKIAQALAAGEADVAQRLAHTLKGLAGALEATVLRDGAAAIEKALMAGKAEEASGLLPALGDALATVVESIDALHKVDAPVGQSKLDPDACNALLAALAADLEGFSPDAGEKALLLAAHMSDTAQATLAQTLADQAEAFDFEAAHHTLNLLRSELQ